MRPVVLQAGTGRRGDSTGIARATARPLTASLPFGPIHGFAGRCLNDAPGGSWAVPVQGALSKAMQNCAPLVTDRCPRRTPMKRLAVGALFVSLLAGSVAMAGQ